MRDLARCLPLLALLALPGAAMARSGSAPAGVDPKSKDPCKNGCAMMRATCEKNCDKKGQNVEACKASCTPQEDRCRDDCKAVSKGQKPQRDLDREDRARRRGQKDSPPPASQEPQVPYVAPNSEGAGG